MDAWTCAICTAKYANDEDGRLERPVPGNDERTYYVCKDCAGVERAVADYAFVDYKSGVCWEQALVWAETYVAHETFGKQARAVLRRAGYGERTINDMYNEKLLDLELEQDEDYDYDFL